LSFLAVALSAVLLAGTSEGALLTSLTSGTSTNWYYSASSTTLVLLSEGIGTYTVNLEINQSNFDGQAWPVGGTMNQNLNVSHGSGTDSLIVQSWVVKNVAGYDAAPGKIGTQPDTLASLGLTEDLFTKPNPSDKIGTSVSLTSSNDINNGSTAKTTTYVNLDVVDTNFAGVNAGDADVLLAVNGPYTLSQKIEIFATQNANNLGVIGTSTVLGPRPGQGDVPEPATLAIWGLGLGVAGLVRLARRK